MCSTANPARHGNPVSAKADMIRNYRTGLSRSGEKQSSSRRPSSSSTIAIVVMTESTSGFFAGPCRLSMKQAKLWSGSEAQPILPCRSAVRERFVRRKSWQLSDV
jgi:hypothetical protein